MKTSDFEYVLPERLIAQTPIEPRDASRLLVLDRATGKMAHRYFRDIGEYLRPGDLLVANESRVIPARLYGRKVPTGGKVELLLVSRQDDCSWEALVRGRHVRPGDRIGLPDVGHPLPPSEYAIIGEVLEETASGGRLIRFPVPIQPLLDDLGVIPLPPYIHTPLADAERYQTIYSRISGSAAAPTAGLHFTRELIERLLQQGIEFAFLVLHISLDTFRPVKEENVENHVIHSEYADLSAEVADRISKAKVAGRRVVAVGTTVVRVLETAARQAVSPAVVSPFTGWTRLFIYPGFNFRIVDALITNFHLPRSTLLMLVSAFAGKELIRQAYEEAIRHEYRFYSFGDSMFIV